MPGMKQVLYKSLHVLLLFLNRHYQDPLRLPESESPGLRSGHLLLLLFLIPSSPGNQVWESAILGSSLSSTINALCDLEQVSSPLFLPFAKDQESCLSQRVNV